MAIGMTQSCTQGHELQAVRLEGLVKSKRCESGKEVPVAREMGRETDLSRRRWEMEDGSLGGKVEGEVEGRRSSVEGILWPQDAQKAQKRRGMPEGRGSRVEGA